MKQKKAARAFAHTRHLSQSAHGHTCQGHTCIMMHVWAHMLGSTQESGHHPLAQRGGTRRGSGLCFLRIPPEKPLNPQPRLSKYLRQAHSALSLSQNSRGGGVGARDSHFHFHVSFICPEPNLKERSSNFKAEFLLLSDTF